MTLRERIKAELESLAALCLKEASTLESSGSVATHDMQRQFDRIAALNNEWEIEQRTLVCGCYETCSGHNDVFIP
jgi:hypothetical protein